MHAFVVIRQMIKQNIPSDLKWLGLVEGRVMRRRHIISVHRCRTLHGWWTWAGRTARSTTASRTVRVVLAPHILSIRAVSYFSLQHEAKVVLGAPPVCCIICDCDCVMHLWGLRSCWMLSMMSMMSMICECGPLADVWQSVLHNAVTDSIHSMQLFHKYIEVSTRNQHIIIHIHRRHIINLASRISLVPLTLCTSQQPSVTHMPWRSSHFQFLSNKPLFERVQQALIDTPRAIICLSAITHRRSRRFLQQEAPVLRGRVHGTSCSHSTFANFPDVSQKTCTCGQPFHY